MALYLAWVIPLTLSLPHCYYFTPTTTLLSRSLACWLVVRLSSSFSVCLAELQAGWIGCPNSTLPHTHSLAAAVSSLLTFLVCNYSLFVLFTLTVFQIFTPVFNSFLFTPNSTFLTASPFFHSFMATYYTYRYHFIFLMLPMLYIFCTLLLN